MKVSAIVVPYSNGYKNNKVKLREEVSIKNVLFDYLNGLYFYFKRLHLTFKGNYAEPDPALQQGLLKPSLKQYLKTSPAI